MLALALQPASGSPAATANGRFKGGYGRTLELTLLAAATVHVIAFLTFPPMTIEPFRMTREDPSTAVELPPEILIPPPPPPMARPKLPDVFEIGDRAPLDVTIPTNDFNPFDGPMVPGPPDGMSRGPSVVEEKPVAIVRVEPVYPDIARAAGATGRVLVEVVVDVTGRVSAARVVRSDTVPVLNAAAVTAARRWLFRPARQQGRPVRARIVIPFEFGLD